MRAATNDVQVADVNSRLTITSIVYLAVIGAAVFIIQPGFVQGLVEEFGFSEQAVGYIASAEVWGIALTSIAMAIWGHSISWRMLMHGSLVLCVVGNVASLATQDEIGFALLRFIVGLGSGGLISITFTAMGLTANPDRNYGYLIMGVLIYGALGLWAIPSALAAFGMVGVLLFLAAFSATGFVLVRYLPDGGHEVPAVEADAVDLPVRFKVEAVLAMFTYFFAQGVMWAYLFLMGVNGGVEEQDVANGLMVSQFLGIGGAMIAAAVGQRFGRQWPLAIGILGGSLVLLALLNPFNALVYALVVCVYNLFWNMTHPFLLAAMASFDRQGKVVVYAVAAQMLGLAVGPAFAAALLGDGNYAQVIQASIVLFVVSLVLIRRPVAVQGKMNAELTAEVAASN